MAANTSFHRSCKIYFVPCCGGIDKKYRAIDTIGRGIDRGIDKQLTQ